METILFGIALILFGIAFNSIVSGLGAFSFLICFCGILISGVGYFLERAEKKDDSAHKDDQ